MAARRFLIDNPLTTALPPDTEDEVVLLRSSVHDLRRLLLHETEQRTEGLAIVKERLDALQHEKVRDYEAMLSAEDERHEQRRAELKTLYQAVEELSEQVTRIRNDVASSNKLLEDRVRSFSQEFRTRLDVLHEELNRKTDDLVENHRELLQAQLALGQSAPVDLDALRTEVDGRLEDMHQLHSEHRSLLQELRRQQEDLALSHNSLALRHPELHEAHTALLERFGDLAQLHGETRERLEQMPKMLASASRVEGLVQQMDSLHGDLTNQVDAHGHLHRRLDASHSEWNDRIDGLSRSHAELARAHSELPRGKDDPYMQILQGQLDDLCRAHGELKEAHHRLAEGPRDPRLEGIRAELLGKFEQLSNSHSDNYAKVEGLHRSHVDWSAKVEGLLRSHGELNSRTDELHKAHEDLARLHQTLADAPYDPRLEALQTELNGKLESLARSHVDCNSQVEQIARVHADTGSRLDGLQQSHADWTSKVEQLARSHADSGARLDGLHQSHVDWTSKVDSLTRGHADCGARLDGLHRAHAETGARLDGLHKSHTDWAAKVDSLNRSHGELAVDMDGFARSHAELKSSHANLESAHSELARSPKDPRLEALKQELLQQLEDISRAHGGTSSRLESLAQAHSDWSNKVEKLSTSHVDWSTKVEGLTRSHIDWSAKVEGLMGSHTDYGAKVDNLEKLHGELSKSHRRLSEAHPELRDSHTELSSKVEELLSRHNCLQDAHRTLSDAHPELRAANSQLASQLEALIGRHSELQDSHGSLLRAQVPELVSRHESLSERLETLLGAHGDLRQRSTEAGKRLESSLDRLAELEETQAVVSANLEAGLSALRLPSGRVDELAQRVEAVHKELAGKVADLAVVFAKGKAESTDLLTTRAATDTMTDLTSVLADRIEELEERFTTLDGRLRSLSTTQQTVLNEASAPSRDDSRLEILCAELASRLEEVSQVTADVRLKVEQVKQTQRETGSKISNLEWQYDHLTKTGSLSNGYAASVESSSTTTKLDAEDRSLLNGSRQLADTAARSAMQTSQRVDELQAELRELVQLVRGGQADVAVGRSPTGQAVEQLTRRIEAVRSELSVKLADLETSQSQLPAVNDSLLGMSTILPAVQTDLVTLQDRLTHRLDDVEKTQAEMANVAQVDCRVATLRGELKADISRIEREQREAQGDLKRSQHQRDAQGELKLSRLQEATEKRFSELQAVAAQSSAQAEKCASEAVKIGERASEVMQANAATARQQEASMLALREKVEKLTDGVVAETLGLEARRKAGEANGSAAAPAARAAAAPILSIGYTMADNRAEPSYMMQQQQPGVGDISSLSRSLLNNTLASNGETTHDCQQQWARSTSPRAWQLQPPVPASAESTSNGVAGTSAGPVLPVPAFSLQPAGSVLSGQLGPPTLSPTRSSMGAAANSSAFAFDAGGSWLASGRGRQECMCINIFDDGLPSCKRCGLRKPLIPRQSLGF
eukprot:TRINITY_DN18018_c0_g1_i1.p1 TRINITY_DN18018_c0_g1~~TRINITY_DN18018_c0_g1_i1.p1  ORF type:complete len:1468 (+),score=330.58 TRINITY_DN18018_c0_g1_i1:80-4483(+)